MTVLYQLATPLPEAERNARIYRGELIIFRDFDAMVQLTDLLRAHCIDYLGNHPASASQSMLSSEIEQAAESLRAAIRKDNKLDLAWRGVMSAINTDLDETYGDGAVVRIQPPCAAAKGERIEPLRAHRDTWGSNLPAQINWWAPLYDTTPERTLAIFPGLFTQAIKNNSAGWDFQEMVKAYRSNNSLGYPLLPTATGAPSWEDALLINLLPGDLLCFSGAHLHASVPNTTSLTRLSFETRTVNRSDLIAGLGAPDVDGSAPFITHQMFRHLLNGKKLGELVRR